MGVRKYHLMKHPDKVADEGFIRVPLNQWAGRRKQGYIFVTADEEAESKLEESKVAEKEAKKKRGLFGKEKKDKPDTKVKED